MPDTVQERKDRKRQKRAYETQARMCHREHPANETVFVNERDSWRLLVLYPRQARTLLNMISSSAFLACKMGRQACRLQRVWADTNVHYLLSTVLGIANAHTG